jgi:hypothetical protein
MTDPWADVREGLTLTNEIVRVTGDYSDPDELLVVARSLLSDADALLAVVRASYREALELWHELNGSDFDEQDFIEWLLGEDDVGIALAALPEHLR